MRVSRSGLKGALHRGTTAIPRTNAGSDEQLLGRIRAVVAERPSYGYRFVTAWLNKDIAINERVNHKRVYRVMRGANLLLARHTGRPARPHEGKVATLKSDLRWCSDAFEIRCWNGERVYVVFALDCCDREVVGFRATTAHPTGETVRDLMAVSIEARFGRGVVEVPHRVEWLSDNGPPFVAQATRDFGAVAGFLVVNTPAYSPESNGMAEAFVKTFKRDYVYLNRLPDAVTVLKTIPAWMEDYNEVRPHSRLGMLSPRAWRRSRCAAA
jgi:putative transposase